MTGGYEIVRILERIRGRRERIYLKTGEAEITWWLEGEMPELTPGEIDAIVKEFKDYVIRYTEIKDK